MTTTPAELDTREDPNGFGTRRFQLGLLGMFVLCVALVVIGIWWMFGDRGDAPMPPATASEQCDLPSSDATTIEGIPDTGWVAVGAGNEAMLIPQTADHGPSLTGDDGTPHCWAQSPLGAVSAASAMTALASTGNQYDLYNHLTVEGPTRDQALASTPEDADPYTTGLELYGFRLVDYDQDEAEVEVVVGKDGASYVGTTVSLVYVDGDWRYDPPTSLRPTVQELTDLDGYHEFRKD